jgi:DNA-binding PadR family transcriptional regulator
MSGKQSNSSKKSNGSEAETKKKQEKLKALKLPKTTKLGKTGVRNKVKDFSSRQRVKASALKSKVKTSFYDKIVHQEVYIDGQEPKSFSFEKKFFGLYALFIFYSLVLITAINFPGPWINFLTLGNPFAFSNTIVAFFLVLSVLLSIDKFRIFIFEKNSAIKQLIVYSGLIALLFLLFLYIGTGFNFMSYLLTLAMIWLVLLSSRFYIYSRKFSTKIEARFIKKYSISRYYLAIIIPFFILSVLVVISLFYRSFLVWLSLDFFEPNDPSSAVAVYNLEMRRIMPLIYFSLVMTLVFIIFEYVSTRRRAETKRAGTFDNLTFSLIIFFIFFFQILQISIYMLLQDETIDAFKATIGATGSAVAYIFVFEFIISMYFLYRIVKKLGKTLGWRILIFKKDGLILLCLACVFAQTLTRFSLASEIPNQTISDVGVILMWDKYIISVLMIFFLGTTILIYYIKPHETSMFMRLQKETVSEEERSLDKVYKIIRNEYIRRGEAYPIEIIERELIKATQLSKGSVYEVLEQLAKKDMDILITEKKQDLGKPVKMLDFVSVTERFEKKGVAQQKARKYLSERILTTAMEGQSKTSRLGTTEAGQPTDSFISSLSTDYGKKQKDKELFQQRLKETQLSFTAEDLTEDVNEIIMQIIKKEYIFRIENPEKAPDFYIPISEITNQIERRTKITPGELYPILEDLSKNDIEFALIENPDEPEDKKIKIFPFADDRMNFSLTNFRPVEYSNFRVVVSKNFLKTLKVKKEKRTLFQLKKDIPNQTESQRSLLEMLENLYKYYPKYSEQINQIPNTQKLLKQLDTWIKAIEKIKSSNN